MTADILHLLDADPAAGIRATAELMEARASAATPGPWSIVPGASNVWRFPDEGAPTVVVPGNGSRGHRVRHPDAEHIAAADPEFTRAVAAWLRTIAGRAEDMAASIRSPQTITWAVTANVLGWDDAIATCRAYLKESS